MTCYVPAIVTFSGHQENFEFRFLRPFNTSRSTHLHRNVYNAFENLQRVVTSADFNLVFLVNNIIFILLLIFEGFSMCDLLLSCF